MVSLSVMAWEMGVDEWELRKIARSLGITGDYAVTQKEAAEIRRMCPGAKTKRRKLKRTRGSSFATVNPTTPMRRAGKDDDAHFVQGGLPESKRR